jgi:glycopeptide antibiotics resistance protein
MTRRTALLLSAAYGGWLMVLVLTPISPVLNDLTVRLYMIYRYDLSLPGNVLPQDFGYLLNVLLFIPVGWIVVLVVRRSFGVAVLFAVLVSMAIELVQLVPALHRDATLSDVITNALGGLIGAGVAGYVRKRRASPRAGAEEPAPTA